MRIVKNIGKLPAIIHLNLVASGECKIAIKGFSCETGEVYFNRYPIALQKGNNLLEFKLPLSPKTICFYGQMLSSGTVKAKSLDIKPLSLPSKMSLHEKDFSDLAKYFSSNTRILPYGPKKSPQGNFLLNYAHNLYLKEEIVDTPARTLLGQGYIECSRKMKDYTVFQRMFILCHEFGHFVNDSLDEIDADRVGADLYFKIGFPATEAYYALTDILPNSSESDARLNAMYNLLPKK